jgi:hypothetical protein
MGLDGEERPSLPVHEWLAVLTILLFMGVLITVTHVRRSTLPVSAENPHWPTSQTVEVIVKGAVETPGTYVVPKGTTVEQLLSQVNLLTVADTRKLHLDAAVKGGQTINIPERAMIEITLDGAVTNPGPLKVPKGTKRMDLSQWVDFTSNADLSGLQTKKRLKEGEAIFVPEVCQTP